MRRFRKEFGLKKARILRERLIPVSQRLKIGINRHPLSSVSFESKEHEKAWFIRVTINACKDLLKR